MSDRFCVLLVEDDDLVRRMLVQALQTDFDLITAEDFPEACLRLQGPYSFSMLVTDLQLKRDEKDGVDVIRAFRERFPDAPVLLISGNAPAVRTDDRLRALAGVEILEKPFGHRKLLEVMRSQLSS